MIWTSSGRSPDWDQISQRDPDVLVLADLSRGLDGDSAQDKIKTLRADPVTAQLAAVRAVLECPSSPRWIRGAKHHAGVSALVELEGAHREQGCRAVAEWARVIWELGASGHAHPPVGGHGFPC